MLQKLQDTIIIKQKIIRIIAATIVLCGIFSAPVFAYTWTAWAKLTKIYPYSGGFIVYGPPNSICSGIAGMYIPDANAHIERLYSTSLAAFLAGKEVRYLVDDACTSGNYMIMSRGYMQIR